MFKKHYLNCVLAVMTAAGAALSLSCSDDGPDTPPNTDPEQPKNPRIELVKGEATTTTLTFVASSWDADKCAYTVIPSDGTVPTAEEILQGGGKSSLTKA